MCQASFLPKQHKKSKTGLAIRGTWERNRRPNKEGRRRRPRRQRPQAANGLACPPPPPFLPRTLHPPNPSRGFDTTGLAKHTKVGSATLPNWLERLSSSHVRQPRDVDPPPCWSFALTFCHPGTTRVIGGVARQGRCEHARSSESCGVGVRNGRQFCIFRNALFQRAPPQMAQNRKI